MISDIENYIDLLPDKVVRYLSVVTPETLGQDYLIHMSTNTNIKEFSPVIGFRQATTEDRTTPRICVCNTILGCFLAYCGATSDFFTNKSTGKKEDFKWKGGWKLYYFDFEYSLLPTKQLVFDVNKTNEHWLVTYNKDTVKYVPKHAANMFYQNIRYVNKSGTHPEPEGTLFLEVKKETGILFSKNIYLSLGYWKVDGPVFEPMYNTDVSFKNDRVFNATAISKEEYVAVKKSCADLLSFKEPIYLNW